MSLARGLSLTAGRLAMARGLALAFDRLGLEVVRSKTAFWKEAVHSGRPVKGMPFTLALDQTGSMESPCSPRISAFTCVGASFSSSGSFWPPCASSSWPAPSASCRDPSATLVNCSPVLLNPR